MRNGTTISAILRAGQSGPLHTRGEPTGAELERGAEVELAAAALELAAAAALAGERGAEVELADAAAEVELAGATVADVELAAAAVAEVELAGAAVAEVELAGAAVGLVATWTSSATPGESAIFRSGIGSRMAYISPAISRTLVT